MTAEAPTRDADEPVIASDATPDPAPVAPQDSEETPSEQPEAEKKGAEAEGKAPPVTRAQLRIREVIRERNSFRAERDQLAARLARLEQPIAADRENLEYDDRERLRTREAFREERREELQEQVQIADNNSKAAAANAVAMQLEASADPEVIAVLNDPNFPISEDMTDFLADTDQAVAITRHLVKNPQLARQLHEMTFRGNQRQQGTATRQSMREADRILLQLEARFKHATTIRPRTATNAPAPGTTLGGGSPPAALTLIELAGKSDDASDYIKARERSWAKGGK